MEKVVQDISALRKKSDDVTSVEEAKCLIKKLEETLSKIDNGVGLAAIQIGHPKRVGVIKKGNGFFHLINPIILEKNNEITFFNEGCLSFPNVYRSTKRYRDIVIKHKRIEGDRFEDETLCFYYSPDNDESGNDGLVAIALQHELEHFDGHLILDHDEKIEPIRAEKKIGRNDPCSCGSGKKYKKCCGR